MTKRHPLVETTDIPSRFAELDAVCSALPARLPGDMDCRELADHWGISTNQARRKMMAIARKDKNWQFVLVRDQSRKNAIVVLRKVLQ